MVCDEMDEAEDDFLIRTGLVGTGRVGSVLHCNSGATPGQYLQERTWMSHSNAYSNTHGFGRVTYSHSHLCNRAPVYALSFHAFSQGWRATLLLDYLDFQSSGSCFPALGTRVLDS